jgi:hypothetical protein
MKSSNGTTRRCRQSARRHFRNGRRSAAVRAFTAAALVIQGVTPTIAAAAERCGSCPAYVQAAIALLQSENQGLFTDVIHGRIPLLAAAREVRRLSALVTAYRQASAADRVAFAKTIGPSTLFDSSLVPAL